MNYEKNLGIIPKYRVERINDIKGKHSLCSVFVLDPQHDPLARDALLCYAEQARDAGYEVLAADLEEWVGQCGRAD